MAEEASLIRDVEPAKLSNETVTAKRRWNGWSWQWCHWHSWLHFVTFRCLVCNPCQARWETLLGFRAPLGGIPLNNAPRPSKRSWTTTWESWLSVISTLRHKSWGWRTSPQPNRLQKHCRIHTLTLLMWENAGLRTELWCGSIHIRDPSNVRNVTSVGEVHEHGCMETDDHIMIAAHNFQMRKL